MNRSLTYLLCVLVCLCSFPPAHAQEAASPLPTTIAVVSVGPMSGDKAELGLQMHQGAKVAVEVINLQGGLLGQKLEYIFADDKCDASQAEDIASLLVKTAPGKKTGRFGEAIGKPALVVGHFCKQSNLKAAPVYNNAGVLQISPAAAAVDNEEETFDNLFRLVGRNEDQSKVIARYLARTLPAGARIGVLHDGTEHQKPIADKLTDYLEKHERAPALEARFTPNAKDYNALAVMLADQNLAHLFLAASAKDAGHIIKALAQNENTAFDVTGTSDLADPAFYQIAGQAGENVSLAFSADPSRLPDSAAAVARFRIKNIEPEGYTLYGYAAVQIWAEAVERAQSLSMEKVANILRSQRIGSVLGSVDFDRFGDNTTARYEIYHWEQGRLSPARGK